MTSGATLTVTDVDDVCGCPITLYKSSSSDVLFTIVAPIGASTNVVTLKITVPASITALVRITIFQNANTYVVGYIEVCPFSSSTANYGYYAMIQKSGFTIS